MSLNKFGLHRFLLFLLILYQGISRASYVDYSYIGKESSLVITETEDKYYVELEGILHWRDGNKISKILERSILEPKDIDIYLGKFRG